MIGTITNATPVMMFKVSSLDVESQRVKLWLGLTLDGIMNGNIEKPAVKMMQALVRLELIKASASHFNLAPIKASNGMVTLPIGANHIQGYVSKLVNQAPACVTTSLFKGFEAEL